MENGKLKSIQRKEKVKYYLPKYYISRYGLNGLGIESFGEMIFLIRPETKPAYYTVGTGSFPRVKRPGCGVNHSSPSKAEIKGNVKLYFYHPLCLHGSLRGEENDMERAKRAQLS